jgi:L(+)-tartrate dehydratase beta subunit
MAALKTVRLKLPATIDDLRKLEIGTVAYLTGRIFTAREGVYKHAIEDGAGMPASKEALGLVNFHCSPAARINPDGTYSVGAIASADGRPRGRSAARTGERRARLHGGRR